MSRKDAGKLVVEIWRVRAQLLRELELADAASSSATQDSTSMPVVGKIGDAPTFPVFFERFLERKFLTRQQAIEVAYNFLASLIKFSAESDCRMFLMVRKSFLFLSIKIVYIFSH